jgi:hypothetical protein
VLYMCVFGACFWWWGGGGSTVVRWEWGLQFRSAYRNKGLSGQVVVVVLLLLRAHLHLAVTVQC